MPISSATKTCFEEDSMAEKKKVDIGEVKLKNVRLSFAHLFQPQEGKVDDETGVKGEDKYNCSFLINKSSPEGKALIAAIKAAAEKVKKAKWGDNIPKLKPEKVCLRDGDLEEYDGYEGTAYVSASNSKPPVLIDRKKDKDGKWIKLTGSEGLLYSGCYVNGIVRLWAQDNKHGKRINASLEAVQFLTHGDAFGAKPIDADEAFDDDDASDDDDADLDEEYEDEDTLL
jgi:hypothetical protein